MIDGVALPRIFVAAGAADGAVARARRAGRHLARKRLIYTEIIAVAHNPLALRNRLVKMCPF